MSTKNNPNKRSYFANNCKPFVAVTDLLPRSKAVNSSMIAMCAGSIKGGMILLLLILLGKPLVSFGFVSETRQRGNSLVFLRRSPSGNHYYQYHGATTSALPAVPRIRLQAIKSTTSPSSTRRQPKQQRDVIIIGGGLAGLSAALYLSQIDPSRHVTILEREAVNEPESNTAAASFAAAGMLAPQSERLPRGHLLDLCMASREMYPDFCELVETLAKESGSEGQAYLWNDKTDAKDMEPWNVGYMASGGFIAPALAGDSVATWAPPVEGGVATWLDETQVRELEPNLHPNVVGGWWFPQDASVDARRLTCSLRAACVAAGVQLLMGPEYEIASLDLVNDECRGVYLKHGKYMGAKTVLVANGAWMRNLLPVPIQPHKGQSLSLRMPADRPPLLRRVLFAQDSYIVPKADGRIVIGATVEAGSFDADVTPAGLLHILSHALELVPGLKDLPIEETWAGLRPTTPDKGPVLGKTPWSNLYLAGGYWRNGVLLAPKTGELLAKLIAGEIMSEQEESLLDAFAWDRFTDKESGALLAANTRYAASMHPVHSRTSGLGVAAAVGTELGSYSTARSASDERGRDRSSLFGNDIDSDAAFELAAQLGKRDSTAYSFGEDSTTVSRNDDADDDHIAVLEPYEGSADAFTVSSSLVTDASISENDTSLALVSSDEGRRSDSPPLTSLDAMYQKIKENKAKSAINIEFGDDDEQLPDPGFRIYYTDPDTNEEIEVPPYTSQVDFHSALEAKKKIGKAVLSRTESQVSKVNESSTGSLESNTNYDEQTYDGYQDIQQANSRASRDEELKLMREARKQNRLGQSGIDDTTIGLERMDEDEVRPG
jgi:thiazole synthase